MSRCPECYKSVTSYVRCHTLQEGLWEVPAAGGVRLFLGLPILDISCLFSVGLGQSVGFRARK